MCKLKKKGLLAAALLLVASLGLPAIGAASVLKGDANVDGRNYPAVSPFVHPPFYNVRVKVETDDTGKIMKVEDNGTGLEGSVATKEMEEKWQAKNKPYWEAAIKAGLLTKFEGKTVVEVEAMQMNTGEADAISGATLVGLATQEAVLNALNGRQGKHSCPAPAVCCPSRKSTATTW